MNAVHQVPDAALGNTSYLVEVGGGLAVAVDPRRDTDELLRLADARGIRVAAALETHLHADFVTGSLEMATATGAEVVAARDARVAFAHRGVSDGERFEVGDAVVEVVATPGHTPEHLAYVVTRGADVGVFSGGSLIDGGAARTDLVAPERTEELARAQFHSLRRLAGLPDGAHLWPTHGSGSFCSVGPGRGGATTIGEQRATNPLLLVDDEEEFVRRLVAGYGSFPPYFLQLRDVNRAGPTPLHALGEPRPLTPEEVADRVDQGAWLVDARPVSAWASGHPRGALSNELRPAFASWLGWMVPLGEPIVLVLDDHQLAAGGLAEAVTLARRIGHEGVVGWLDGGVDAWRSAGLPIGSVDTVGPEEAAHRLASGALLLDVRQAAEVAAVHVPQAVHVELGDILAGKHVEADDLVVFCGHGERSATAASVLAGRGLRVANLAGGLPAWERAGFTVQR